MDLYTCVREEGGDGEGVGHKLDQIHLDTSMNECLDERVKLGSDRIVGKVTLVKFIYSRIKKESR